MSDVHYEIMWNIHALVHYYPVDGFQCEVWELQEDDEWVRVFSRRMIGYTAGEGIAVALCEAFDWDWDNAVNVLANADIDVDHDELEDI